MYIYIYGKNDPSHPPENPQLRVKYVPCHCPSDKYPRKGSISSGGDTSRMRWHRPTPKKSNFTTQQNLSESSRTTSKIIQNPSILSPRSSHQLSIISHISCFFPPLFLRQSLPPKHGVARHLVLGCVADEALRIRKGHVARRGAVACIVDMDIDHIAVEWACKPC